MIFCSITSRLQAPKVAQVNRVKYVLSLVDPIGFDPKFPLYSSGDQPDLHSYGPDITHKVIRFYDINTSDGGPSIKIIQEILDFGKTISDGSSLLVHCEAGISRSSAAALLIMIQHEITQQDGYTIEELAREIKAVRPQASPNRLMIKIGESLLGMPNEILPVVLQMDSNLIGRPGWPSL